MLSSAPVAGETSGGSPSRKPSQVPALSFSPRADGDNASVNALPSSMHSGVGTRGSPPITATWRGRQTGQASGLLTCAHKVRDDSTFLHGAPLRRALAVLNEDESPTVMARAPPMMRPPPALPKMSAPSTRRPRHRSAPAGRAPRRTEEPARPNLRSGTSSEDRQQDGERGAVREPAGRVRASRSRHNRPSTSPRDPSLPIRRQRPDHKRRDASPPVTRVRIHWRERERHLNSDTDGVQSTIC